jgi:hypothetical protein
MRLTGVFLFALVAITVMCAAPALAATCNISGTVTDAAGLPVQGASVTIFDYNRAEVSTMVTNAAGQFSFTGLHVNTDLFTVRVFYNNYQRTYTNPSYFFDWYPASGDQVINSSDTRLEDLNVAASPTASPLASEATPGLAALTALTAIMIAAYTIWLLKNNNRGH